MMLTAFAPLVKNTFITCNNRDGWVPWMLCHASTADCFSTTKLTADQQHEMVLFVVNIIIFELETFCLFVATFDYLRPV